MTDNYGKGKIVMQKVDDEDDEHIPIEKIKFNFTTMLQIIALIIAIVTQYNVVSNEIDANKAQIQLVTSNLDVANSRIKVLESTITKLEAQNILTNEIINGIQIRLSVEKHK
jgi:hypothetical protein